jgi:hypothetical protein
VNGAALIASAAALLALLLAVAAASRVWRGWLDLKLLQLGTGTTGRAGGEVRALRERVRRLERIALGLD